MTQNVRIIRDAITKVTKMLSGMDVEVTQRGHQAFVIYHPATGKVRRVNIPYLPDNASDELIMATQGFLDHEVAHALFTDGKSAEAATKKGDKKLHSMHNILEDCFIERKMAEQFRGSEYNLGNVRKLVFDTRARPGVDALIARGDDTTELDWFKAIAVTMIRAMAGHTECKDFMSEKDLWSKVPDIATLLDYVPAEIAACKNSWDTLALAERVIETLRAASTPPPEASDDPEDDQSDDGDDSDDQSDDSDDKNNDGETADTDETDEGKGGKSDEEDQPDAETEDRGKTPDGDATETDRDLDGGKETDSKDDEQSSDDDEESSGKDDQQDDASDAEDGDQENDSDSEEADASDEADKSEGIGDSEASDTSEDHTSESDGEDEDEAKGEGSEPITIDEAVTDAIAEMDDFEETLGAEIKKLYVTDIGSYGEWLTFSREHTNPVPYIMRRTHPNDLRTMNDKVAQMIGPMSKQLERLILAQRKTWMEPGKRTGRLNPGALHRIKSGDDRLFRNKRTKQLRNTVVSLLVDISGSMAYERIETAAYAAYALSQMLSRVNIPFEVLTFSSVDGGYEYNKEMRNSERELGRSFSQQDVCMHMTLKGFNERMTPDIGERFAHLGANRAHEFMQNNCDPESVELAARRLTGRTEDRKILMVLSDGQPYFDGDVYAACDRLKKVVPQIERAGIEVVGVGIQTNAVKDYYPKNVVINRVEDLPAAIMKEMRTLLLK